MAQAEKAYVLKGIANHPNASEDGAEVALDLYDDLYLLLNGQIDGRVSIPGDGLKVKDYLGILLGAVGFAREQYESTLEDLGVDPFAGVHWGPGRLNTGYDEFLWVPEVGRTWMRYIQEILMYSADARLWIAPETDAFGGKPIPRVYTGCRWCRTLLRSADPDDQHFYMRHLSNGPASAGCLEYDVTRSGNPDGIDYHIYTRAEKRPAALASEHIKHAARDIVVPRTPPLDYFYNRVTVKGPRTRTQGSTDQMAVYAEDFDSVDGVATADMPLGYVKEKEISAKWITNWPLAKRIVLQEYYKATYVPRFVQVPIPLQPEVRVGDVFALYGGERESVNNTKWRVTKVDHHLECRENLAVTTLTGWYIGNV